MDQPSRSRGFLGADPHLSSGLARASLVKMSVGAMEGLQQSAIGSESDDGERPVLILGAGWVGSRLAASLKRDRISVVATHRPSTDVQSKPPFWPRR